MPHRTERGPGSVVITLSIAVICRQRAHRVHICIPFVPRVNQSRQVIPGVTIHRLGAGCTRCIPAAGHRARYQRCFCRDRFGHRALV